MHNSVDNLLLIKKEIQVKNIKTKIVAVTKTFPIKSIYPLINHGHEHFGENKVQEAIEKWSTIKFDFPIIKLHFIGKLQSNKVKFILPLFDYIHSLDSLKLAEKISIEQDKKKFKPKIFIQVNIGNEEQKNGIEIDKVEEFVDNCKKNYKLNIIGLMCIPPVGKDSETYFNKMNLLNKKLGLNELSMGMSSDYLVASKFEATFVRVGSKIFGSRD